MGCIENEDIELSATEKECQELATALKRDFPRFYFEVVEDLDRRQSYYIGLLSDGPDYAPDLQAKISEDWRWSGWDNRDQRNNMGILKKRL